MAAAPVNFSGLVLSRRNYRESDMLVKIMTDEFGKRMFIFHRARKPGFKMGAAILPFTMASYAGVIGGNGLSYVTAVRGAEQFQLISNDIELNAYATYVLELIDIAFPDGERISHWYAFAKKALELINNGVDAEIITNITEIQLLGAFGVAPHWENCVICGRADLPLDFSEQYGGVLCQNHWALDERRYHATARAIYYLRLFSIVALDQLQTVNVNDTTKRELRAHIDRLYDNMVGVSPRAKRFLTQMERSDQRLKPLAPRKPTAPIDETTR